MLSNDNYVVSSPHWDNNSASDAGAVTWGNGATGTFGLVNGTNSLIGDGAFDQIGSFGVAALTQWQLRGDQPGLGQWQYCECWCCDLGQWDNWHQRRGGQQQ